MKIFFTVLSFSLLLVSCHSTQKSSSETMISQGISGQVKQKKGNQMPSPDVPESGGQPLITTVFVYENTNLSQVKRIGSSAFYDTIYTKFIKSVETDKEGRYVLALPVGNYSVFTKIEGKFYSNHFDTQNNIAPVTVQENKLTELNITVSAAASF